MFDRHLIPVIRSPLTQLAKPLCRAGVSANQVSLTGFAIGMLALPLLAFGCYQWALAAILLNRLLDGLDGAVARETGITDCGGFLDITLDFIFYAAVVLGFALAAPANALPAATLLFAFMGTGSSFLAFAIMAGKRGIDNPVYHHKSLYYLGGLTEGSETIALFVLMCLWPAAFAPLAYGFALLCAITTLTRLWSGYHTLRPPRR
ncbi:CDP-alcohol phosphatidyltransferase family protein [Aeromonas veronii]|uniref:CDP-alcohol phosphatidyltransferase family protein n=1 Tax=Aeromonas veronii TaxID=654 RepID=UPI00195CFCAC|nr:CDP-alcohol phosphatidyltransferase family protein [Aeromonas veronii]